MVDEYLNGLIHTIIEGQMLIFFNNSESVFF